MIRSASLRHQTLQREDRKSDTFWQSHTSKWKNNYSGCSAQQLPRAFRDPFTGEPSDLRHLGSSAALPAECSKISRKGYGSLPSLWPGHIAEPLHSEHCQRLLTPWTASFSSYHHSSIRCSTTRLLNNWTASCHQLSSQHLKSHRRTEIIFIYCLLIC